MKDVEVRKTPLQIKMDELGKTLSIFSFGIIVVIGLVGMVQGKTFLSMFNIGVSLAVAAIPEGLPICVTVTLALGVMRMAKKNAIVKKLPAVEALGCANYICSDKTGTLTENKMTAMKAYCPAMDDEVVLAGIPSGEAAENSTLSSSDDLTKIVISSSRNGAVSSVEKGCYENGKLIDISKRPCLYQMFEAACICNNAYVTGTSVIGQPTEGALLIAASSLGVPDKRPTVKRTAEIGFTSETKKMEVTLFIILLFILTFNQLLVLIPILYCPL
jgi:Ca2+-transporting ATPase